MRGSLQAGPCAGRRACSRMCECGAADAVVAEAASLDSAALGSLLCILEAMAPCRRSSLERRDECIHVLKQPPQLAVLRASMPVGISGVSIVDATKLLLPLLHPTLQLQALRL
mmetsp:Transcript_1283/g.3616  ORF Transcript_1283/g.3616 Transcript_1283/m.3616 type:complete len:113 (+) Transcript_1283:898-1236(+)